MIVNMKNDMIMKEVLADISLALSDPMFSKELYTSDMLNELAIAIFKIKKLLSLQRLNVNERALQIEQYVAEHVSLYMAYFASFNNDACEISPSELIYRTAYSAACLGKTTCYGFSELVRILLLSFQIPSKTILAKFPKEKYKIMHYTTLFKTDDGRNFILDPERRQYCLWKKISFEEYMDQLVYVYPNQDWYQHKLDHCGVGRLASEVFERHDYELVKGLKQLQYRDQ